jgi:hypothetical protein
LAAYKSDSNTCRADGEIEALESSLGVLQSREAAAVQAQIAGIMAGADPSVYVTALTQIAIQKANTQKLLVEKKSAQFPRPVVDDDPGTLIAAALADVSECLTSETLTEAEKHDLLSRVIESIMPTDASNSDRGQGFVLKMRPFLANQSVATIRQL